MPPCNVQPPGSLNPHEKLPTHSPGRHALDEVTSRVRLWLAAMFMHDCGCRELPPQSPAGDMVRGLRYDSGTQWDTAGSSVHQVWRARGSRASMRFVVNMIARNTRVITHNLPGPVRTMNASGTYTLLAMDRLLRNGELISHIGDEQRLQEALGCYSDMTPHRARQLCDALLQTATSLQDNPVVSPCNAVDFLRNNAEVASTLGHIFRESFGVGTE